MFAGIIRDLKAEDRAAVEAIFDLYWQNEFRTGLSEKLTNYLAGTSELKEQDFHFFVAEENGEIVGVAAMRKVPQHMLEFARTDNAAEFYVSAVKYKGKGIGTALRDRRIEEAMRRDYTEVLFFSGKSHQDSWPFHDKVAERVGETAAPNGEQGNIWRIDL
jgi:L-amino acid N-acyltransferase YncA